MVSRPGRRCIAVALLALVPGCAPDAEETPSRSGRYGIFRDLVLLSRSAAKGGPFFLDRFETTRADWLAYCEVVGAPLPAEIDAGAEPSLPITYVDHAAARRYARWRFGRLPTVPEWRHAVTGGGRYRLPWGDPERPAWANTGDLGLGRLTPVGAFESGRGVPDGAYDLLGNASEWTESVPIDWLGDRGIGWRLAALAAGAWALRTPTLSVGPFPAIELIQIESSLSPLPRYVAGSLQGPMLPPPPTESADNWVWSDDPQLQVRAPDVAAATVGVRVAASPRDLVEGLLAERSLPAEPDLALLRRFLRQPEHREVIAPVFDALPREAGGPLAAVLAAELAR